MAPQGGAADSYYNAGGAPPPMQYQQGPQSYQVPQYPPPQNGEYQQPPPNYGQNYQNATPSTLPAGGDGKQTFAQAFKIDKPKYNDLWAGILVR